MGGVVHGGPGNERGYGGQRLAQLRQLAPSLTASQVVSANLSTVFRPPEVAGFSMIGAASSVLPQLDGAGLVLRGLTSDDEPQWRTLIERNRSRLRDASSARDATSRSDFAERLANNELAAVFDQSYAFGVFEDGNLLGEAVLHDVARDSWQRACFSMFLDADRTGQGRAQACFVLLLQFAFDVLALHRVDVLVLLDDVAVHRALAKLGLEPRWVDPEATLVRGSWRDLDHYVVPVGYWHEHAADWRATWLSI